ncbi:MAG: hypothetical protein ACKVH8_10055 [Pirellulales bacterium]
MKLAMMSSLFDSSFPAEDNHLFVLKKQGRADNKGLTDKMRHKRPLYHKALTITTKKLTENLPTHDSLLRLRRPDS